MKGTVKFFNSGKGFGFIAGEDGKEYFVHQTGLVENYVPGENDAVTFDVVSGDRGPKAANVAADTGNAETGAAEASEEAPESDASEEETTDEASEAEEAPEEANNAEEADGKEKSE